MGLELVRRDPHLSRLWAILVSLIIFFAVIRTGPFMSLRTWQSMAIQFPEFGIMALGVMVAMLTSGIDLSVVGTANMTSIAAATVMLSLAPAGSGNTSMAIGIAVVVALVMGALAGLVNGVLISLVRIPAILATLGTLELFTGIAIVLTQGRPISGLPVQYSQQLSSRLFGVVPMQLVIFIVVALLIAFLIKGTTFGSKIYLLGTNQRASVFSGLDTSGLLIKTYVLSGVCASVAGLVMLANYNSAKADYGVSYTLLTVLIVVLGGVNPNGGSGKLSGVVLAVVILQVLSSGLNMFPSISNFYRPLIWGAVLLLVVSTTDSGRRLWKRLLRKE